MWCTHDCSQLAPSFLYRGHCLSNICLNPDVHYILFPQKISIMANHPSLTSMFVHFHLLSLYIMIPISHKSIKRRLMLSLRLGCGNVRLYENHRLIRCWRYFSIEDRLPISGMLAKLAGQAFWHDYAYVFVQMGSCPIGQVTIVCIIDS